MEDHAHDRFLGEWEGSLHFGCINPFCGHGNPALPRHYKIPLDSKDVMMKLVGHEDEGRKVEIEVIPKDPKYRSVILRCDDNMEACSNGFNGLKFPER